MKKTKNARLFQCVVTQRTILDYFDFRLDLIHVDDRMDNIVSDVREQQTTDWRNKMKIESTKGEFLGNSQECVEWLEEMQPSHASVVIGDYTATVDAMPGEWKKGLRTAVVEITEDSGIDGGEEEWQQYLTIDQLAEKVENE